MPVVFWRISTADERRLDAYEGFPRFYYKKEVDVETDDGIISGLVYIMHEDRRFGSPEDWYYQNMERDYRRFGFAYGTAGNGWKERGSGLSPWMTGKLRLRELKAPSSSSMMPGPSMYSGIRAAVSG